MQKENKSSEASSSLGVHTGDSSATPSTSSNNLPIVPSTSAATIKDADADISTGTAEAAPPKKKIKVQSSLSSHITRPISLHRQEKINNLILNMIVKDLQPLSIVRDKGFVELITALEPTYKIPSRSTFTTSFLNQQFNSVNEKLKSILVKSKSISLTTDAWTATNNTSYIAYTAHFITDDWMLYSCLLECAEYDVNHTAKNLRDDLLRVTDEWKIRDKIITVTTDNAANIVAAVRLTEWGHIGCIAHTINLIVQSGLNLPELSLRKKIKSIVEYFHRSTQANNKLFSIQKQLNPNATLLKLKMDVATRWNSTFYMFERLLKLQESVTVTIGLLHNPVELLTEEEWNSLSEMCNVLKPFEQITIELSSEKAVTLSKLIVIMKGLKSAISKIKSTMAREKLEKDVGHLINLEYQKKQSSLQDIPSTSSAHDEAVDDDLIWGDFDKLSRALNGLSISHLFIPANIGTLVLIKDNLVPPLKWRIGRIVELYPGKDGISRVALVRTAQGMFKRPLVKLCALPSQ
ncbi:hypothetical protein NQ318_013207 [Aromia moschata]|uniref:DUF5641 domain-containing protein n=1 Tax=Aromia moschata TaxID=1265417 RepID=A0AAV8XH01_9CUCU|nr:hypothetical protein NQ318_013207 [Aromia moschata]